MQTVSLLQNFLYLHLLPYVLSVPPTRGRMFLPAHDLGLVASLLWAVGYDLMLAWLGSCSGPWHHHKKNMGLTVQKNEIFVTDLNWTHGLESNPAEPRQVESCIHELEVDTFSCILWFVMKHYHVQNWPIHYTSSLSGYLSRLPIPLGAEIYNNMHDTDFPI